MGKFRVVLMIMMGLLVALAACNGGSAPTPQPTIEPTAETLGEPPYFGIGFNQGPIDEQPVITVDPGGPADMAGLRDGDVLVAINRQPVTAETLAQTFQSFFAGDVITVSVLREEEALDFQVTLGRQPDQTTAARTATQPFLGVRMELGETAVTIIEVMPDSPAADAGLTVGDRITEVNGAAIERPVQIYEYLQPMMPGTNVTLKVQRAGTSVDVTTTLREPALPTAPGQSNVQGNPESVVYIPEEAVWEVEGLVTNSFLSNQGFLIGDRVTAVNGRPISPEEVQSLINSVTPNDRLTFTIERDGETIELETGGAAIVALGAATTIRTAADLPDTGQPPIRRDVTPGPPPLGNAPPPFAVNRPFGTWDWLGMTVVMLDEEVAEAHEVDVTEGALITEVEENMPAELAGLQEGDVITAVNDDVVDLERDFYERLFAYERGAVVTLSVLREGETLEIDLTLNPLQSGTSPFSGPPGTQPTGGPPLPQGNPPPFAVTPVTGN